MEAVLPLESQIPSLKIVIQEGLTQEDNACLRLEAQQRQECYQARISRAFNKMVHPHSFKKGDLVLAMRRHIIIKHRIKNKFTFKWDGSYVIQEVYFNDANKLVVEDDLRIDPINGKILKRYYP